MAGYKYIYAPEHAHGNNKGYVAEHRVIAEHVLGYALPAKVQTHHVNEKKKDNRHSNLVICENQTYHKLLHRRAAALRATGSAHALRCSMCKQWGFAVRDHMSLITRTDRHGVAYEVSYHRACKARENHYYRHVRRRGQ